MGEIGEGGASTGRPTVLLEWKDLTFDVQIGKGKDAKTRRILKGVSGYAAPGELLAIMGSSGAGKTTLLNLLSARARANTKTTTLGGTITLNGVEATSKLVRSFGAYVMQDDVFYETLTPRELFDIAGSLKMPKTTTEEERKERVDYLINLLGLKKAADTMVGGPNMSMRGLSGGEKKRTAVGIELVSDPPMLFLDEPTSGLDSSTAFNVIDILRQIAKEGNRTVICTIHQPSSEIFHLFDKLYLMVDGRVIYHGDASSSVDHFAAQGYPCPKYSNPADYFMMQVMKFDDTEEDRARVSKLVEARESIKMITPDSTGSIDRTNMIKQRIPWYTSLEILMKRSVKHYFRQPLAFRAKLGQSLILSILVGILFLQIGNNQSTISDRDGALFIVILNGMMNSIQGVVLTFTNEKTVFLRETANKMYGPTTYFFAKILSEAPFEMVFPTIYVTIAYFLIGFQSKASNYFLFWLTMIISNFTGIAIGFIVASVAPSSQIAVSVFPVTIVPLVLFSGLFIDSTNVPAYFRWIEVISPFKYAYRSIKIIEFDGLTLTCDESEYKIVNGNQVCPFTSGNQHLAAGEIEVDEFWPNIGILLAIFIGGLIISFVVLRIKSKRR